MKHIFRTTWKYWWREVGFMAVLFFALAAWTYWLAKPVLMIGWLLLAIISLAAHYKLFRARLELDENGISVRDNGLVTTLRWSEIHSIKLIESWETPNRILEVVTKDGDVEDFLQFTLDQFDCQQIWRLINKLGKRARRNNVKSPPRVSDSWMIRIGGWFCLLLGLSFLWFFFADEWWRQENDPYVSLVIGCLVGFPISGLGLFVALTSGTTEIDQEKITRRTLLKKKQMRWNEIKHIEEGENEYAIYGRHGRLVLPSEGWWSGKATLEAILLFEKRIKARGIEIKPMRSLFHSKNSKAG